MRSGARARRIPRFNNMAEGWQLYFFRSYKACAAGCGASSAAVPNRRTATFNPQPSRRRACPSLASRNVIRVSSPSSSSSASPSESSRASDVVALVRCRVFSPTLPRFLLARGIVVVVPGSEEMVDLAACGRSRGHAPEVQPGWTHSSTTRKWLYSVTANERSSRRRGGWLLPSARGRGVCVCVCRSWDKERLACPLARSFGRNCNRPRPRSGRIFSGWCCFQD